MELDKCITRTDNLSTQLRTSIVKDIEKIAESLCLKYDIVHKPQTSDEPKTFASTQDIAFCISQLYTSYNTQTCSALTKSGIRCSLSPTIGSKYCKQHIRQAMQSRMTTPSDSVQEDFSIIQSSPCHAPDAVLGRHFIGDTLYLVDDKFIYDIDTKQKVGYRDAERFVLTDDPFELGINCF